MLLNTESPANPIGDGPVRVSNFLVAVTPNRKIPRARTLKGKAL